MFQGMFVTFTVVSILFAIALAVMVMRLFKKVEQGKALIVSTMRAVQVSFTGRVVFPVIHKAEIMDISVKTIEIDRRGKEGLICRDNIRADIKVNFFVRVNKTSEDVVKVAQAIGCARASDPETLEELFSAKFSEALKTVGKQLDFVDLYTKRHEFRDQIIEIIGTDLNGYVLEDAAIDYLEQTPLSSLDENNILDAQGIKKITELTSIEHIRTNDFRNNEKKQITKQDVEAAEAIFELERQKADAQAKQLREIATVKSREEAETLKVQAEELQKSESARLRSQEEIKVQEQNQMRQIEVAQKNRERVVAIETERVEKDRMLEVIGRERETELQRIAKDKEVEVEKREIAGVIRQRIEVERTVAEQEEGIKRVRVVEEAERLREAAVITAESQAQEQLVKDIKSAEAAETAAGHKAREQVQLAEAAAQEKLIHEVKAAEAEEQAAAHEARRKLTIAQADLEVTEKDAEATVKRAEAELEATNRSAEGRKQLAAAMRDEAAAPGLGQVEVREREAEALEKRAKAIGSFDDAGRLHEEFRLGIETRRDVDLAGLGTHRDVAEQQAKIIAEGLREAKIDIVGGESVFFDRLTGAIGLGKAVDSFFDRSDVASGALGQLGQAGLKAVAERIVAGDSAQRGEVVALLDDLASSADEASRAKVEKLRAAVTSLGVPSGE